MSEPDIILTPSAARRVAWIAERQARPAILRLAVDGGGCAGFTYRFELGEVEDGDSVAETDGVRLVVDAVSLDLVEGSAVDFVEDGTQALTNAALLVIGGYDEADFHPIDYNKRKRPAVLEPPA